jgi:Zn-finger nucleic acid-binding protein
MENNSELLQVNDWLVERKLTEPYATQRCHIPECQAWCCTGGVWIDLGERDRILAHAEQIKPFMRPERQDERLWFDGERDESLDYPTGVGTGTSVVKDETHPVGNTCIFLRPEDRYCAIQSSSMAKGDNPWALKPFYCILHPITMDGKKIQLDDDNEIYIEGGSCQRPSDVARPLIDTFDAELQFVLGVDAYAELKRQAAHLKPGE